jgi:hypothetical protein
MFWSNSMLAQSIRLPHCVIQDTLDFTTEWQFGKPRARQFIRHGQAENSRDLVTSRARIGPRLQRPYEEMLDVNGLRPCGERDGSCDEQCPYRKFGIPFEHRALPFSGRRLTGAI